MKIFCDGSRHYTAQIASIEEGFRLLGHEVTQFISEADLVYANDAAHYKQALLAKAAGQLKSGAKVILTCLDIAEHLLPELDLESLRRDLSHADAVCSISQFVQQQLTRYLNQDSTVIYQPIRPITYAPQPRSYTLLSAGRRSDRNKRSLLWVYACVILGINQDEIALAGEEPGWGTYLGVQSNESLSRLYNEVDFVAACGRIEGMGLPALEGMSAGVIPTICHDYSTREEFFPAAIFPEFLSVEPNPHSIAMFMARHLNNAETMADMKQRLRQYYLSEWEDRTSPAGVAQAILNVYDKL